MPIYEYYCAKCQVEFELMLPFSKSGKPVRCTRCKTQAKKLLSNFASKTGSCIQSPLKPLRDDKPAKPVEIKQPKKGR